MTDSMQRREFFRRSAIVAAGGVAADQLVPAPSVPTVEVPLEITDIQPSSAGTVYTFRSVVTHSVRL